MVRVLSRGEDESARMPGRGHWVGSPGARIGTEHDARGRGMDFWIGRGGLLEDVDGTGVSGVVVVLVPINACGIAVLGPGPDHQCVAVQGD